jgi:hypothetical protein
MDSGHVQMSASGYPSSSELKEAPQTRSLGESRCDMDSKCCSGFMPQVVMLYVIALSHLRKVLAQVGYTFQGGEISAAVFESSNEVIPFE